MKQENIIIRRKETSIKLQASQIISVRVKDIERKAVRVYEDGIIGISGAIGNSDFETLKAQAIDNLQSKIPYPFDLEKDNKDHRNYIEKDYTENEIVELTEKIITSLNEDFDDFIFSESVKAVKVDQQMSNSEGLDLSYKDSYIELGIIVKAKSSPNLFDTFLAWGGRNIDLNRFLKSSKDLLIAERNKVDLPKGEKLPVFFLSPDAIGGFLTRHLNGELYGNNASFFDDKLGEKLFNEKINIIQDNNPKKAFSKFYDNEGVTKENDSVHIIENGVLKNVFTDKKTANKFKLEHTGSASGAYDDIPKLGGINMVPKVDSKNIKESINNKPAILCLVAAGGDFNADGNYATPVQASYLFDGEKIIGKLPDFNMNNNIYEMLGNDYIGTFDSKELYFSEYNYTFGCYMNIKK